MMLYFLDKVFNCLDEALLRPLAYVINKFVTGVYYFLWGSYFLGYCLVAGSTRAWHLMIYTGCELQRYYNLLYNNFLDLAGYFYGGTRDGLINTRDFLLSSALFLLGLLDDLGKVGLWVILLLPRAILTILDYILAFVVHSNQARCLRLFNSLFRISIGVVLLLVLYMFRRYVYLLLNYQLQRARTEISEKTQSAYLWTERQLNRIMRSGSSKANDEARPSSCVVCMERRTNIVILPCRHLCLCAECSVQLQRYMDMRDRCPICRESIDVYMRVYINY
ncbi:mitochondrial ubiquitin ligase activator of NFKB 1 [Drosophila miranda]|uniref:mitochondrial ubiquitin ligase activator of NFKB 1 n=1 Tax=Drosophila miranda TaxID=7229 RepID=UPI0007E7943E|nr:mitochondrial ubiquitin ligase activator of NFKB 1 [Drosophila miranda]